VRIAPRGGDPAPVGSTVTVGSTTRVARADLRVDHPGDWEVLLDDGRDTARVPVSAVAPPAAPHGGLVLVVLLLGVALALVAVSVRRQPRVAVALGAVALVALTASITVRLTAAPATAATTPSPSGMSGMSGMSDMDPAMGGASATTMDAPVEALTRTVPESPVPGGPAALELDLVDGATGAPVDDLAVHDDALVHLVVAGPGGAFSHDHPIRTGPGRYLLRTTFPSPGRYAVFGEIERIVGGVQLVRSSVTVPGAPAPEVAAAPGPGVRDVGDVRAEVTTSPVVVGRPVSIALALSRGGTPVTDLQPWLGMAGHLLALGPATDGTDPADPASRVFAHVHDMRPVTPGAPLGPDVGFTYTFPRPGRYALWLQVQRAWQVMTVPVTIDVPGAAPQP
jgi:hypothetical protein